MTTITHDSTEIAAHYIDCMLKKVGKNKGLAERLLKKVFVELALQIDKIEQLLNQQEMAQAKAAAHKINGAVSFCGFVEIQQLAKTLETLLATEPLDTQAVEFLQLKQKVTEFLSLEAEILRLLSQG